MNVDSNDHSDGFVLPSCDWSLNLHGNIWDLWLDDKLSLLYNQNYFKNDVPTSFPHCNRQHVQSYIAESQES